MEDGWLFLRVEWRDLFNPAALEVRITKLIASAGPDGMALLQGARTGAA